GCPLAGFQKRNVLSAPQVTRICPLALNATPVAPPVWPGRLNASLPSAVVHTLTIPSLPAPATRRPSGLSATALTVSACTNSRRCLLVGKSQIFAVLSELPEATSVPSGLTATLRTRF